MANNNKYNANIKTEASAILELAKNTIAEALETLEDAYNREETTVYEMNQIRAYIEYLNRHDLVYALEAKGTNTGTNDFFRELHKI